MKKKKFIHYTREPGAYYIYQRIDSIANKIVVFMMADIAPE